ncbi:MAG: FAD-binding protein [Spirochaetaceae bacterium]|jgi:succinate dehydrogenase/fumarate reductase flavoprotein subunit|nr:FAD-binding protein [Spirochaetaceae bacterium]
MELLGKRITLHSDVFDVLIIGTGAAGYNAAVHLHAQGVRNFAILTENRFGGASRNTGSDKQTYYKVSCAGAEPDAPRLMAETLFAGGSMDGDTALCEAAHSLEEFFHLVSLGVGFPRNRYGEFPGYKTDHDPLQRASSTGPYTSKDMTECLEAEVIRRGIRIIDKTQAVKLLSEPDRAYGALCLNESDTFTVYFAKNIIFAAGGPAGLYQDTVYPPGHFGASGVLAREGAVFANITEWQYGIGSIGFRWNLSGSYQQAVPRYIAVDKNGDEEEFLSRYFSSPDALFSATFMKGYQWPFNPERILNEGSSLIDWAVYIEKHLKGKRIYLDFTRNPLENAFALSKLNPEAYQYLANSNALGILPIDRLLQLNPGAYRLYKDRGVDLAEAHLEIDVLPQHHNGGAEVSVWWETSIPHLFAAGECAGTHGVKRPGGSALNAGQVGGLRAAFYIAEWYLKKPDAYFDNLETVTDRAKKNIEAFAKNIFLSTESISTEILSGRKKESISTESISAEKISDRKKESISTESISAEKVSGRKKEITALELLRRIQNLNSASVTFLRTKENAENALAELDRLANTPIRRDTDIRNIFKAQEILLLSRLLYEAVLYYIERGGKSRGSYLILDRIGETVPLKDAVETDSAFTDAVILSRYDGGSITTSSRPVRPIPDADTWFERVWRDWREKTFFV